MTTNSIPISVFSTCDRSREIWSQLNELRGVFTAASYLDCDLKRLTRRFENLRDDLAMHYAHEWGGMGALRWATLNGRVSKEKLSIFLQEQTQIYGMISDLAADTENLLHAYDVSPKALLSTMDRFRVFDAILISHESRKSMALHGR